MVYLKTSEKEDKGIVITPLSKKILNSIEILDNLLTPLELWIIDTLDKPRTVKEIRDFYVVELGRRFGIRPDLILKFKDYSSMKEFIEKQKPKIIPIPELSKTIENELKTKKIRIPSYDKFDNILLSLEKLGITARRYDLLRKGKWLWVLNPHFLIALKESKKK